jgi:DNA polymerase-3 subunit delta'
MARLFSLLSEDRLTSSLLFAGRKGVGKWLVAQELAAAATCPEGGAQACGECASCRQAGNYSHPDILYLFPLPKDKWEPLYFPYLEQKRQEPFAAASNDVSSFITIDSIRRFESKLARKPSLSRNRVGIIYEAERMLPAAMDALLKTLEEPPPASWLIVITDQPRFLPQTILSRLMRVNFPPLSDDFVSDYLKRRFDIDDSQAKVLVRFAAGSLYQANTLIEGDYAETREAAIKMFESALHLAPADLYIKHVNNSALDSREKVEQLLIHWQSFIRDLAYLSLESGRTDPSGMSEQLIYADLQGEYSRCAQRVNSFAEFALSNENLEKTRGELRRNVNPRMAAIDFLLELTEERIAAGT